MLHASMANFYFIFFKKEEIWVIKMCPQECVYSTWLDSSVETFHATVQTSTLMEVLEENSGDH